MKGPTKVPERNPSRERMQAELRHLREMVRELEQKRDELEAPASGFGDAWRKVAEYEAEMRQHAEELNAALRVRLEEQIAVMERLHELIDDQMKAMPEIDAGIPLKYSDPGVFERFLDDIHQGYEMTDSIMNSVEWGDNTDSRTWRVSMRSSEYNGRSRKVLVLQNEFRNPTSAIVPGEGDIKSWDHSVQYVRASPMQTDALRIQEGSSIAVRYRDKYSEFGRETLLYTNWMMKRFLETNREVQVWRKTIMGERNQGVDHAAFVEMVGWVVYLPAERGVIIRHCVHLIPKFLDEECYVDASYDYPHVGDLVSSALGSLQVDLTQVTANMSTA